MAKVTVILNDQHVPIELWIGKPVSIDFGKKIGRVISASPKDDGRIELVCEIDDHFTISRIIEGIPSA